MDVAKWMIILIGLATALVPSAGSAQEIGASFTVRERPAQPELVATGTGIASAEVPSGWAYDVSRGEDVAARAPRLARSRGIATEVVIPASSGGDAAEPVTVMFVPI